MPYVNKACRPSSSGNISPVAYICNTSCCNGHWAKHRIQKSLLSLLWGWSLDEHVSESIQNRYSISFRACPLLQIGCRIVKIQTHELCTKGFLTVCGGSFSMLGGRLQGVYHRRSGKHAPLGTASMRAGVDLTWAHISARKQNNSGCFLLLQDVVLSRQTEPSTLGFLSFSKTATRIPHLCTHRLFTNCWI